MSDDITQQALDYHSATPAGKLRIQSSKSVATQEELSLTYTPGVGKPCEEIAKNPENVYKYTGKANNVAVITDGSAVLGLGDIGPQASLPVMEGKAVLFKKFANIDAFPICIEQQDSVEAYIQAISPLSPTFGGINLEDIKAPLCFELQEKLDALMPIPVFHDDQYGTAVILTAGIKNALKITNKDFSNIKICMNGAGAAGIATAKMLLTFGVPKENIFLCDSRGLITKNRENVNPYKAQFAQDGDTMPLQEAIKNKDVFIGISVANLVTAEMVKSMNTDATILAVANPVPEIMPDIALAAGARVVGTGRSDFPNQVNNSLGFPGIFRGTLDTRATTVNDEMKRAASEALASLTHEAPTGEILQILQNAYPGEEFTFSESYIIPKQFDLRVVPRVARRVAEAAMSSGVAQIQIPDLDEYENKILETVFHNWAS